MDIPFPDNYFFPAFVEHYGNAYSITFPDLPGCVATGPTMEEALKEALGGAAFHLWSMEQDGDPIPSASHPEKVDPGQMLCYLDIPMASIRTDMDNRSVKKTLTIPYYPNKLGESHHVNFSRRLQDALKSHLGVKSNEA